MVTIDLWLDKEESNELNCRLKWYGWRVICLPSGQCSDHSSRVQGFESYENGSGQYSLYKLPVILIGNAVPPTFYALLLQCPQQRGNFVTKKCNQPLNSNKMKSKPKIVMF
eukprot:sb/3477119/